MTSDEAQYNKMTMTPVPKLITSLAIPTIISMLITSIYNMADTYFVSQLDDTSATGAIGVVFSLMAIIQAVAFTLGMGSGSWISRLLGNHENEKANKVGSGAFLAALIFGTLLMIFGRMFIDPLMHILGATDSILPYAKAYGQYILYAAPIMAVSFVLNNILRAEGKAKFAMYGIAAGGILNIILDPIFIFDFGFGLKTAGAAIATAISQLISFLILLYPYLTGKTITILSFRAIPGKLSYYYIIFKNGLPSLLRQGLASISVITLNLSAAAFAGAAADAAIAGMGIVAKLFMFIFSVVLGFGQGYQPVVGYNYGAHKYARVKEAFMFTLKVGIAIMTVSAIAGFIFAPRIMALFSGGKADPDLIAISSFAFRAQCITMPLIPIGVVCNMTFQSVGKSWQASFLSACRQGIYYLPVMLILPNIIGLTGIQITQPIADLFTAATCVPFIVSFFRDLNKLSSEEPVSVSL